MPHTSIFTKGYCPASLAQTAAVAEVRMSWLRSRIRKTRGVAQNNSLPFHPEIHAAPHRHTKIEEAAGRAFDGSSASTGASTLLPNAAVPRGRDEATRPPQRAPPSWNTDYASPRIQRPMETRSVPSHMSTAQSSPQQPHVHELHCRRSPCPTRSTFHTCPVDAGRVADSSSDNRRGAAIDP